MSEQFVDTFKKLGFGEELNCFFAGLRCEFLFGILVGYRVHSSVEEVFSVVFQQVSELQEVSFQKCAVKTVFLAEFPALVLYTGKIKQINLHTKSFLAVIWNYLDGQP
ncbi:hypothetical protein D3C85_994740 [compost metagenome]